MHEDLETWYLKPPSHMTLKLFDSLTLARKLGTPEPSLGKYEVPVFYSIHIFEQ